MNQGQRMSLCSTRLYAASLRRARQSRGLARPQLRRVTRGKPRALARKAATARGFATTHRRWHVRTTINIQMKKYF